MHPMDPPEDRDGVEEHMLEIDREVEEDDRKHDCRPGGQGHLMEEPPGAFFRNRRKAHGDDRHEKANQEYIKSRNREIPCLVAQVGFSDRPAGGQKLPDDHHEEDGREASEAHSRRNRQQVHLTPFRSGRRLPHKLDRVKPFAWHPYPTSLDRLVKPDLVVFHL